MIYQLLFFGILGIVISYSLIFYLAFKNEKLENIFVLIGFLSIFILPVVSVRRNIGISKDFEGYKYRNRKKLAELNDEEFKNLEETFKNKRKLMYKILDDFLFFNPINVMIIVPTVLVEFKEQYIRKHANSIQTVKPKTSLATLLFSYLSAIPKFIFDKIKYS